MNTMGDRSNVATVKKSGSDEHATKTANESSPMMDFSLSQSMSFDAIMTPRMQQLKLLLSNVTGMKSVPENDDDDEVAAEEEEDVQNENIPPTIQTSDSENNESKESLVKRNRELEKLVEEIGYEKKLEGQQYRHKIRDLEMEKSNKQKELIVLSKKYDLLGVQTDRLQQELAAAANRFAEVKKDFGVIILNKEEEIAELKEQLQQEKNTSKEYMEMIKKLKTDNANLTAMTLR